MSLRTRWSLRASSVLNLEKSDGPVWETRLSSLATTANWPRLLSWSPSSHLGPCLALLHPPLDPSPCRVSFCHWLKIRSSVLSYSGYPLIHQQKFHPWAPTACSIDQELWLSSGKPNGPIWHSTLSSFPVLEAYYPIVARRSCNDRLLCSNLHGQNLLKVLTFPSEVVSTTEPTVHTTLPKVDKVDTSSAEDPTAQALAAQPRSKASDDYLIDDDLDLLNFVAVES
jgi:hypothetical protein